MKDRQTNHCRFLHFFSPSAFKMPRYKSGIKWFGEEQFLGSIVTFSESSIESSVRIWKLEQKLTEHESCVEERWSAPGGMPEARAMFVCSSGSGSSRKEAMLRIRMQYGFILLNSQLQFLISVQDTLHIYIWRTAVCKSKTSHRYIELFHHRRDQGA